MGEWGQWLNSHMAVYFPKYVTVNNPRLAVLHWCCHVVIFVIAFSQFMWKRQYMMPMQPGGDVTLCTSPCQSPPTEDRICDAQSCAGLCTETDSPCLHFHEALHLEPQLAFVATSFSDCVDCPKHVLPGARHQQIALSHRFRVDSPPGILTGSGTMAADSRDVESEWEQGMATVLFDGGGQILRTFEPGLEIKLAMSELLSAATIEDNAGWGLDLDDLYTREELGIHEQTLRKTGVTLDVNLYYVAGSTAECAITDPEVQLETFLWAGPICCMRVHAKRDWTSMSRALPSRENSTIREYHGIFITFAASGHFEFLAMSAIFRGLTTILIWAQIPLMVIYWFSITFLGHLSTVYSRAMHQSLSLSEACQGLASRLVSHSAAFMDMQDLGSGISKDSLLRRLSMILSREKDLDANEVEKFVDFVFRQMLSSQTTQNQQERDIVNVQGFCAACTTNEPLRFDSLVQIFDKDRRLGCLETAFVDDTVKEVHKVDETKNRASAVQESSSLSSFRSSKAAHHSQLEKAMADVHRVELTLDDLEGSIRDATKDCSNALEQELAVKDEFVQLLQEVTAGRSG